jgi:hypothetical protein
MVKGSPQGKTGAAFNPESAAFGGKSGQVSKILQAAFASIRSLAQAHGPKGRRTNKNGPAQERRAVKIFGQKGV